MPELTFNPQTELVLSRQKGEVVAITAFAPVRGRSLQRSTFSRDKDPAIVDLLLQIAARAGDVDVELDEEAVARLTDVGLLVAEDQVSAATRFRCPLRDPPLDLLPRRATRAAPSLEHLHVNPALRYQDELRPPDEGHVPARPATRRPRRDVNPFAEGLSWAWIEHPDAPAPSAFSIDETERDLLRRLRPGEPAPSGIAKELVDALLRADILVDPADIERRREAWARDRDAAAEAFLRDRSAVLHGLIHPTQIAALRRYYRDLVAQGHATLGDGQIPQRYWAHNEPLARSLHERLTAIVTQLAGEPVKPSYVYFTSYRHGAVLSPHRDRPQCAISVSLLVDYEPEPVSLSPWPLWLKPPSGPATAIHLGLGDGLFYRGIELSHYRRALPRGHISTSLLLHYVPAGFTGALD